MKQQLPHWRVDNYFPILLTIISWAFFAGIFVTKLNVVIESQKELVLEVREWKKQFEGRLGKEEKISSVVLNVLKLDIQ